MEEEGYFSKEDEQNYANSLKKIYKDTGINVFDDKKLTIKQQLSLNKLDSFLSLTDRKFTKEFIDLMKEICLSLDKQPDIFPLGSTHIQLEFDGPNGEYLEFEIEDRKLFQYAEEYMINRKGDETYKNIGLSRIKDEVEEFYGMCGQEKE